MASTAFFWTAPSAIKWRKRLPKINGTVKNLCLKLNISTENDEGEFICSEFARHQTALQDTRLHYSFGGDWAILSRLRKRSDVQCNLMEIFILWIFFKICWLGERTIHGEGLLLPTILKILAILKLISPVHEGNTQGESLSGEGFTLKLIMYHKFYFNTSKM